MLSKEPRRLDRYALGIDFGTSGARAIAIDAAAQVVAKVDENFISSAPCQLAQLWQGALWSLLDALPLPVRRRLGAITIDGTSATVLLCDARGQPIADPLLYNDDRGRLVLDDLQQIAPHDSPARSATSGLAKAMWWWQTLPPKQRERAQYLLHQADWLSWLLHNRLGISDYHNALKLGCDVGALAYPGWLSRLPAAAWFPQITSPGEPVGIIQPAIAERFAIAPDCLITAGTTDSIAAFLASGAATPGEAVTSLGSTLVLKLLSTTRLDVPQKGIYSHRLGNLWLVGGASNTGGAVLKQFFTDSQIKALSQQIDPAVSTELNYYPLPCPGERFPISDPDYLPRLTPRPPNSVMFLNGLLEGIAQIEADSYQLLTQLGATPVTQIYTAGGGAKNKTWQAIRSRLLKLPIAAANTTDAAYGSARLAQNSIRA
ncbi:MAG: FGGY-family carbohydrate kinase [Cyanobacteria bacterium P01_A01_bin.114]